MASVPLKPPHYGEAALLIAISFGWFIYGSVLAVADGFPVSAMLSDSSLTDLLVMELLFGAMALGFLRACGYDLRELLPAPTWRGCAEGALLWGAATVACIAAGLLASLGSMEAQPIAQILSLAKPSLGVAVLVSMLNGLYEETFLLGYLTRRHAAMGASFAVGLSVLVRLLCHLYQGPAGAATIVVYGIVQGAVYWRTRRLWPAVVAHVLSDLVALA